MSDIRDDFILCVRLEDSRITYPLENVVLCGGRLPEEGEAPKTVTGDHEFLSFRDAINRRCLDLSPSFAKEILIAEKFQDWLHHSRVDNLIEFELNLADLSALVVLVLEGPGAFAELGSFSVLPRIASKLVVITNPSLIDDNSFIRLGPLKFMESQYPDHIFNLEWKTMYRLRAAGTAVESRLDQAPHAIALHVKQADDCINKIEEIFTKVKSSKVKFDRENSGHISLLVAELLFIFHGLKIRELESYVEQLGIEIKQRKLKEILYVLEKLEIVRKIQYLNDKFYTVTPSFDDRMHFTYDEEASEILPERNKLMLRHLIREQYRVNDTVRFRALGL